MTGGGYQNTLIFLSFYFYSFCLLRIKRGSSSNFFLPPQKLPNEAKSTSVDDVTTPKTAKCTRSRNEIKIRADFNDRIEGPSQTQINKRRFRDSAPTRKSENGDPRIRRGRGGFLAPRISFLTEAFHRGGMKKNTVAI